MNLDILVVDEDIACRDVLQKTIAGLNDTTLFGVASNGKNGLDKIKQKAPDLVLLSNGLKDISACEFIHQARTFHPDIGVIILSKSENPQPVIEALEAGAFDFIYTLKGKCTEKDWQVFKRKLISKIHCFEIEHFSRKVKTLTSEKNSHQEQTGFEKTPLLSAVSLKKQTANRPKKKYAVVLIGVSTGGPQALVELLPAFPASFPLPILIVLHMPKSFTKPMADELNKKSALTVTEAMDGEEIRAGEVYLAPGGLHLKMEKETGARILLKTSDTSPENGCKPSVDVLFRSAAEIYNDRVVAIILTGMGTDGVKGCMELKHRGAWIIVQDKESSLVWGMPGSAVQAGCVDKVLPLNKIAEYVQHLVVGT